MKEIDFGVQSYCFRHFPDNAVVAGKVRGIGLDKIELCAVHADFNDPDGFAEVAKIYREEGVEIISIGVQTFTGDDQEKSFFECAARVGARHLSAHVSVASHVTAIAKLQQWSREFSVKIGLHCHGGYMFGGAPDVLRYLIDLGAPEVGLCIDTAWAMQIGPRAGDPVKWAKDFAGHIHGVHFKDFVFGRDGMWEDVIVGTGNLDLPAFVDALHAGGFSGMAVIEYEADVTAPDAALKACVESMRASLAQSSE